MDSDTDDELPCCGCLCCEKYWGWMCLGTNGLQSWKNYEKRFWQQKTWSLEIFLDYRSLLYQYIILFVVLAGLGAMLVVADQEVVQTERVRYDNRTGCDIGETDCVVPLSIPRLARAPVIFYYAVNPYYQGARTYKDSYSSQQLMGTPLDQLSSDYADLCTPRVTPNPDPPQDPFSVQPNNILLPCGVVPWSIFNDTMTIFKDEQLTEAVQVSQAFLAVPAELENLYQPGPADAGYTEATNEFINSVDFAIWQRRSAFPFTQKPLYRIEEDLPEGTYYVQIQPAYPVAEFSGQKFIYAQSLSFLGTGGSLFLGICYLVFGGLSAAIVIWILFEMKRGRLVNPILEEEQAAADIANMPNAA